MKRTIYVNSTSENGDISFEAIRMNEMEDQRVTGGGLVGTTGWLVAHEECAEAIESMINHAPGLRVTGREVH